MLMEVGDNIKFSTIIFFYNPHVVIMIYSYPMSVDALLQRLIILSSLQNLPDLIAIKDANFSDVDAVFCCLPHGTTQVHSYIF